MIILATVIVKDNNVEKAIRQLRKKVDQENIIGEYKKRMFYVSKGEKARERKKQAVRQQPWLKEKEK